MFVVLTLVLMLFVLPSAYADICFESTDCTEVGYICDISTGDIYGDCVLADDSPSEEIIPENETAEVYACISDLDCLSTEICDLNILSSTYETCISDSTIPSTTLTNTTTTSSNTIFTSTDINQLDTDVGALKTNDAAQDTKIQTLQDDVIQLEQDLASAKNDIQILSGDQALIEANLESEVDEALAGLAALEDDLGTTKGELTDLALQAQKEEERANLLKNIALVIIVIAVFVALAYFMLSHGKHRKEKHVPEEVKKFITKHIKMGQGYPEIRKKLIAAGWPEPEIKRAYKLTSQHNYFNYLKASGKVEKGKSLHSLVPPNNSKIIMITVLSIFIMGALIMFVSNSTGHAIYTGDNFAGDVLLTLEDYITQNDFFQLINSMDLCVQVDDDASPSVSYRVLKASSGHVIIPSEQCDWDPDQYGFAVKFTSWERFSNLARDLDCTNIELHHIIYPPESGVRGFYVLPSKNVASGFLPYTATDYTQYCPALRQCLSPLEVAVLGIGC